MIVAQRNARMRVTVWRFWGDMRFAAQYGAMRHGCTREWREMNDEGWMGLSLNPAI
jgi:hypothetical protein